MRAPLRSWRARIVTVLAAGGLAGALQASGSGCATGSATPEPAPASASPAPSTAARGSSTTSPARSVPEDGVTLGELGFSNGPAGFTVPRDAVLRAAVDQPNVVTLVLSAPPPAEVARHLAAALPAAGYQITAEAADGTALTFSGHGWSGGFTAADHTSAIVLRPQ